MNLRALFEGWLQRKPSVHEIIGSAFPEGTRAFANAFYSSWANEESLPVELGDRLDDFELYNHEAFFRSASFYFFSRPIVIGEYCVLGADSEDEMGTIVLNTESGKVHYAYGTLDEGTLMDLADSFPQFIAALESSGWKKPAADN